MHVLCVPARGALAALLCARWSPSGLETEDVDGPGLLSIATSDTVRIHRANQCNSLEILYTCNTYKYPKT